MTSSTLAEGFANHLAASGSGEKQEPRACLWPVNWPAAARWRLLLPPTAFMGASLAQVLSQRAFLWAVIRVVAWTAAVAAVMRCSDQDT